MNAAPPDVDRITAALRREDELFRRRTLLFTLACVVIGVAVFVGAGVRVDSARKQVSEARREIRNLESWKQVLDRQIAERDRLIAQNASRLPADLRSELEGQAQANRAQLAQLDAQQDKPWRDLGLAAARSGRYDDAIQAYSRAIDLNPSNEQVRNWRGYALLRKGDASAAAADFRAAAELDGDYAEAHYNLALALWKLNQANPAIEEFRRAVDLDPDLVPRSRRDPQAAGVRRAALSTPP